MDLDHILDCFEEQWSAGANPPDLRAHIDMVNEPDRAELVAQLIEIDLERRWQAGGRFPIIAVEAYLASIPELELSAESIESIVASEFVVRCEFGDCPSISDFADTPLCDSDSLRRRLVQARAQVNWPTLRVIVATECVFHTPLDRPTELGRQQLQDPPPVTSVQDQMRRRVIVCESGDASISRQQLDVRLVKSDEVRLTNLSSNRAVAVRGSEPLAAGDSRTHTLPVWIPLTRQNTVCVARQ